MKRIGLLIFGLIILSVSSAQRASPFEKSNEINHLDSLISIVNLQEER